MYMVHCWFNKLYNTLICKKVEILDDIFTNMSHIIIFVDKYHDILL